MYSLIHEFDHKGIRGLLIISYYCSEVPELAIDPPPPVVVAHHA
jgi:hypothetical protein